MYSEPQRKSKVTSYHLQDPSNVPSLMMTRARFRARASLSISTFIVSTSSSWKRAEFGSGCCTQERPGSRFSLWVWEARMQVVRTECTCVTTCTGTSLEEEKLHFLFLTQRKTALPSLFFFWQLRRFACGEMAPCSAPRTLQSWSCSMAAPQLFIAHVTCNYLSWKSITVQSQSGQ